MPKWFSDNCPFRGCRAWTGEVARPHTNFDDSFLPARLQRAIHAREIRAVAARDDFPLRNGSSIRSLRNAVLLSCRTGRAHGGGWEGANPAVGRESRVSSAFRGFHPGGILDRKSVPQGQRGTLR